MIKRVLLLVWVLVLASCGDNPDSSKGPSTTVETPPPTALPAEPEVTSPLDDARLVPGVTLRFIESNGIRMRIAEKGEGPVVLLAHGWPESWYSWRHQISALAASGFRVVAPDMRGYGHTDAPQAVEDYGIRRLAADMVGVLDALGVDKAHMIGHDWGAPVATFSVLLYPERFESLVMMSVPYGPRSPSSPIQNMTEQVGDNFFYMLYHNEPGGVAEAEYDANPRALLSRLYLSPDSLREPAEVTDPKRAAGGWIPRLGAPKSLPSWLSQHDLDYYVSQFEHAGFRGGLNYYRNLGPNWEATADLANAPVPVPALFVAGEKDLVIQGATAEMLEGMMAATVPDLRDVVLIPGIGHWVQQEAPKETNAAVLDFLTSL